LFIFPALVITSADAIELVDLDGKTLRSNPERFGSGIGIFPERKQINLCYIPDKGNKLLIYLTVTCAINIRL